MPLVACTCLAVLRLDFFPFRAGILVVIYLAVLRRVLGRIGVERSNGGHTYLRGCEASLAARSADRRLDTSRDVGKYVSWEPRSQRFICGHENALQLLIYRTAEYTN